MRIDCMAKKIIDWVGYKNTNKKVKMNTRHINGKLVDSQKKIVQLESSPT